MEGPISSVLCACEFVCVCVCVCCVCFWEGAFGASQLWYWTLKIQISEDGCHLARARLKGRYVCLDMCIYIYLEMCKCKCLYVYLYVYATIYIDIYVGLCFNVYICTYTYKVDLRKLGPVSPPSVLNILFDC